MAKPTTGKVTFKLYRCECGHESQHSTNHYGEFYARCPKCSWKSPMAPTKTHTCLEPLPKGMAKSEPWQKVTIGELLDTSE